MKWDNFPYLVVAYTAAVCLFIGFVGGNLAAQSKIDWINWIGATDGWLAAFVGAVTIFAILFQIRKSEATAHRKQEEAKQVFDKKISESLIFLNGLWKCAEDIRNGQHPQEQVSNYYEIMKSRVGLVHGKIKRDGLEEFLTQMHPIDAFLRKNLISTMNDATSPIIEHYFDHTTREIVSEEISDSIGYFDRLNNNFNSISLSLEEISPELFQIFKNRNKLEGQEVRKTVDENLNEILLNCFPQNTNNPY